MSQNREKVQGIKTAAILAQVAGNRIRNFHSSGFANIIIQDEHDRWAIFHWKGGKNLWKTSPDDVCIASKAAVWLVENERLGNIHRDSLAAGICFTLREITKGQINVRYAKYCPTINQQWDPFCFTPPSLGRNTRSLFSPHFNNNSSSSGSNCLPVSTVALLMINKKSPPSISVPYQPSAVLFLLRGKVWNMKREIWESEAISRLEDLRNGGAFSFIHKTSKNRTLICIICDFELHYQLSDVLMFFWDVCRSSTKTSV